MSLISFVMERPSLCISLLQRDGNSNPHICFHSMRVYASKSQHSTAQRSTAQRSAAQHSAAQRSTAQHDSNGETGLTGVITFPPTMQA